MLLNRKAHREIDMLNGPLMAPMIQFAVPLMLSGILQLFFNAADVIVVGRFAGDTALAAVGSTGSLTSLITNLFIGLSMGTNVIAATAFGARDMRRMTDIVHTSMLLSVVCGVILTVVGVPMAELFLRLLGTPADVIGPAGVYLRIYFCGMPATMIYNFGAALLRSAGDTKKPLVYLTISGAVNVVLNLVFVIYFKMNVAGVALATIISQYISAALIVICLIKSHGVMHLEIKKLRIDGHILLETAKVGLPAGLQGMLFNIANVTIQSSINSYGSIAMAGNSVSANVEGFVYTAMNAFYQSAVTFSGQNYGARNLDRIRRTLGCAMLGAAVVGIVGGIGARIFGRQLLGLYTSSEDVIACALIRMTYICIPYCFNGMMDVVLGVLRGMGHSVETMITSLIGACFFRIFWVTVVCDPPITPFGRIYLSYPISWLLTIAAHFVVYFIVMSKLKRHGFPQTES